MTPLEYCKHPFARFSFHTRKRSVDFSHESTLDVTPRPSYSRQVTYHGPSQSSVPRSEGRSSSLTAFAPRDYQQYSARLFELDDLETAKTANNEEEQEILSQILLDKVVAEVNCLYANRTALSDDVTTYLSRTDKGAKAGKDGAVSAELARTRLYACQDCSSQDFATTSRSPFGPLQKLGRAGWSRERINSCQW